MRSAHVKLLDHIGAIYKDCKIDKADLEAEGLGVRPLTAAENMGRTERNILARRYYRLGQWSEALQGDYWLTVGSISGHCYEDAMFADEQDPESEVFRYYSIANKLDDTWFSGAYALASSCMSVFEAHGYSRSDCLAVNSYSRSFRYPREAMPNEQSFQQFEASSTVSEPKTHPRK